MKVTTLAHNYPPHPGGLEAIATAVATGLARLGHQVTVVTTAWNEARTGVVREDGVEVIRLAALHASERFGVPWPLPLGPGLTAARRAIRRADVLHAHGALYATSLLGVMVRRSSTPLVLTEHVGWVPYPSSAVRLVESVAWRSVGRVVLSSTAVATAYNRTVEAWLRSRATRLPVVSLPNGVDCERFRPRPDAKTALRAELGLPAQQVLGLFVGRDTPKKNLAAALAWNRAGWTLVVCGATRRLPADVVDLGLVPWARMSDIYAAVDFVVLPSAGEGFPVAIQEAAASGTPVVLLWDPGYEASAPRSVLRGACDTLAELEAFATRLASDPDLRSDIARPAEEWARTRWSWPAAVERYSQMLEAAVAPGSGTSSDSGSP